MYLVYLYVLKKYVQPNFRPFFSLVVRMTLILRKTDVEMRRKTNSPALRWFLGMSLNTPHEAYNESLRILKNLPFFRLVILIWIPQGGGGTRPGRWRGCADRKSRKSLRETQLPENNCLVIHIQTRPITDGHKSTHFLLNPSTHRRPNIDTLSLIHGNT